MIVTYKRHNRNFLINTIKMIVTYVIFLEMILTFLFTQLLDLEI